MVWLDDWAKRIEIQIDGSKIDSDLSNFPVFVELSSGTGINNVDTTDVFHELSASGTGATSAIVFLEAEGDLSSYKHSIFFNGAHIQQINGETAVYFNGSAAQCYILDGLPSFDFGVGDFTVECYFCVGGSLGATARRLFTRGEPSSNNGDWTFGIDSTAIGCSMRYGGSVKSLVKTGLTWSGSRWYHVVLQRRSTEMSIFVDGVLVVSGTHDFDMSSGSRALYIGSRATNSAETFFGYIKNMRISKGIARYDNEGFIPPERYSIDSYTSLLWYGSNDGEKAATFHNLNTVGNEPALASSILPNFGTGAAFYINGSSDLWQIPHSSDLILAASDFTIEFWGYLEAASSAVGFFNKRSLSSQCIWIFCGTWSSSDLRLVWALSNNGSSWTVAAYGGPYIPLHTWFHAACVREGSEIRLYYNGVLFYTGVFTGSVYDAYAPLTFGALDSAGTSSSSRFRMYGFRISKNIARYSGYYSPPDVYAQSNVNRKKIAFTDTSNNILYTEIACWDHDNKKAALWVKVPTISSGVVTRLYLYYDKTKDDTVSYVGDIMSLPAQQVWDEDFVGVYHLDSYNPNVAYKILDSTAYANHAISVGSALSVASVVNSVTGFGMWLDGSASNIYAEVPVSLALNTITGSLTLETIYKSYDRNGLESPVVKGPSYPNEDWGIDINTNTETPAAIEFSVNLVGSGRAESFWNSVYPIGTFDYVAGRYDGYFGTIFFNGDKKSETVFGSYPIKTSTTRLVLFNANNLDKAIKGIQDETRISRVARSDAWIKATYYSNWNELLTFGSIETVPVFFYEGYVYVMGQPVERKVCLYRRSTGELVDTVVSSGNGYFKLKSSFTDYHYVIVLPEIDEEYKLLFDDKIHPEI